MLPSAPGATGCGVGTVPFDCTTGALLTCVVPPPHATNVNAITAMPRDTNTVFIFPTLLLNELQPGHYTLRQLALTHDTAQLTDYATCDQSIGSNVLLLCSSDTAQYCRFCPGLPQSSLLELPNLAHFLSMINNRPSLLHRRGVFYCIEGGYSIA